jgi:hypothetical protein
MYPPLCSHFLRVLAAQARVGLAACADGYNAHHSGLNPVYTQLLLSVVQTLSSCTYVRYVRAHAGTGGSELQVPHFGVDLWQSGGSPDPELADTLDYAWQGVAVSKRICSMSVTPTFCIIRRPDTSPRTTHAQGAN